jgi:hypothetical protein
MYGITYSLRDGCTYLQQIPLDDAVAAFNPTERIKGKTIFCVRQ